MTTPLTPRVRYAVLFVAFTALLFDGMELGLMPIAAGSVAKSFLGDAFTTQLGGIWFSKLNASLLLGAAMGDHVTIRADGDGAEQSVSALVELIEAGIDGRLDQVHADWDPRPALENAGLTAAPRTGRFMIA